MKRSFAANATNTARTPIRRSVGMTSIGPCGPLRKFTRFMSRKAAACSMLLPIEARRCAIIDPVLDFDRRSGTVSHQQAKDILNFIHQRGGVARVLDTHPHADHFRPPPAGAENRRLHRHR